MKLFKYISIFSIIAIIVFSASCVKEKNFPPEPTIEFVKFINISPDSAKCIISFKDGDGDIGIEEGDTISENDFKLKYLYKGADDQFHPYDAIDSTASMDTLFFSYRVPNITPKGQFKALEGQIKTTLYPLWHLQGHDIIKFEITLRDRAGHISNMVSTNEIVTTP